MWRYLHLIWLKISACFAWPAWGRSHCKNTHQIICKKLEIHFTHDFSYQLCSCSKTMSVTIMWARWHWMYKTYCLKKRIDHWHWHCIGHWILCFRSVRVAANIYFTIELLISCSYNLVLFPTSTDVKSFE